MFAMVAALLAGFLFLQFQIVILATADLIDFEVITILNQTNSLIQSRRFIIASSTFLMWVLLSFASWIMLYFILKPVSTSILLRDQFLANARHELRTPLTILRSEIELFSNHPLSESVRNDLQGIQQQTQNLIELSQNLLEQLSEKEQPTLNDLIEIKLLIIEIYDQISHSYKASFNFVEWKGDWSKASIKTNKSLFTQLLTNIIENAFKHGDVSKPLILICDDYNIVIQNSSRVDSELVTGQGISSARLIASKLSLTIDYQLDLFEFSAHIFLPVE
jgi:signal transduction histidine kinase